MIEGVRAALIRDGGILNPPATDEEIRAAEVRLGLALPAGLRALYRSFNGSQTATEEWRWQFWTLDDLAMRQFASAMPGTNHGETGLYLGFCDTLICAPLYALRVDERPSKLWEVWMIVGEANAYRCCIHFTRFLELFPVEMDHFLIEDTDNRSSQRSPAL